MIGDLKTIHAELDKIFATIVAQHYDPEEARYLAFFLFSDIARQYHAPSSKRQKICSKI